VPVQVAELSQQVALKIGKIQSKVLAERKALSWQMPKPKMIRQFNPRFDADFNPDRSADPVKERAEEKKLKQRQQREMKHAKRELHQDSIAMAEVRDNKQASKNKLKEEKMNRHLAELEAQQHNYKETGGIMHDGGAGKPKRDRKKKK